MQMWGIAPEDMIGMEWDTTASNTGGKQGSATLFEEWLGHSIMWVGCRHHIGELHSTHADIIAQGKVNGEFNVCYQLTIYILSQNDAMPCINYFWLSPQVLLIQCS